MMTYHSTPTFDEFPLSTSPSDDVYVLLRVFVVAPWGAYPRGKGADIPIPQFVVRPRLRRAEGRMKGVPIPPFAKGGGTQPKHSKLSVQQSLSSTEPALTSPSPLTRRGAAAAATSNQTPF